MYQWESWAIPLLWGYYFLRNPPLFFCTWHNRLYIPSNSQTESGSRAGLRLDSCIFVHKGETKNPLSSSIWWQNQVLFTLDYVRQPRIWTGNNVSQDNRTAFITRNCLEISTFTWLLAVTIALKGDLINNQVKKYWGQVSSTSQLITENWYKLFSQLKDNQRK